MSFYPVRVKILRTPKSTYRVMGRIMNEKCNFEWVILSEHSSYEKAMLAKEDYE